MKILEIGLSIAIVGIILAGVVGSLTGLRGGDALVSSTETVLSALQTARGETLAYKYGKQYGVHFASTTVTVFPGSVWSAGLASTTVFNLTPGVVVSSLKLTGGGVDLVFDKLTGKTSQYGTTTLQVTSGVASTTIVVEKTGIIYSR